MVKTDKNFKLSKSVKRVLATMTDAHSKGHFKRLMIDAEVAQAKAKLAKIRTGKNEEKVS